MLICGVVPLALIAVYPVLRSVINDRRLRLWAAASYALLPVWLGGTNQGRLSLSVFALLLPLLVLAVRAVALRRPQVPEAWRGGWGAGVVLVVLAAFEPSILVGGVAGRRRSRPCGCVAPRARSGRIGIALGLPLLVLLPWWPSLSPAPGRLFVGPDAAAASVPAAPAVWQPAARPGDRRRDCRRSGSARCSSGDLGRRPARPAAPAPPAAGAGGLADRPDRLLRLDPAVPARGRACRRWAPRSGPGPGSTCSSGSPRCCWRRRRGIDGVASGIRGRSFSWRAADRGRRRGAGRPDHRGGRGLVAVGRSRRADRPGRRRRPAAVRPDAMHVPGRRPYAGAGTGRRPGPLLGAGRRPQPARRRGPRLQLRRLGRARTPTSKTVVLRLAAGTADSDIVPALRDLGIAYVWVSGATEAQQSKIDNTPGLGAASGNLDAIVWQVQPPATRESVGRRACCGSANRPTPGGGPSRPARPGAGDGRLAAGLPAADRRRR